jgi:hypothetical protein
VKAVPFISLLSGLYCDSRAFLERCSRVHPTGVCPVRDFTKLEDNDDIVLASRFLGIAIEGSRPTGRGAEVYLQELIGHPSLLCQEFDSTT